MSFKCKIGLHSWNGCKCSECEKTRDEQHDWSKDCEECSKCAKTRNNQHEWNGCKCTKCEKIEHETFKYKCNKCKKTVISPSELKSLIKVFKKEADNYDDLDDITEERENVIKILSNVDEDSILEVIVNYLTHKNSDIVRGVVRVLGACKSPIAFQLLINKLNESDSEFWIPAAKALGLTGNEAAIKPLIKIAREDSSTLRKTAIEALGNIGGNEATSALFDLFTSSRSHSDMWYSTLHQLGKLGDERVIEPLIELALSEGKKKSYYAPVVINFLGGIGSKKAVLPLIELLNNKDKFIKSAAKEALDNIIDEEELVEIIQENKNSNPFDKKEITYIKNCLSKINVTKLSTLQSINGKSIQGNQYSSSNEIKIIQTDVTLDILFKCISDILTTTGNTIMDMEVRTDHMGTFGKEFEVIFLRLVLDLKYLNPGEERHCFGIFQTSKGQYTCLKWTDIDTV